MPDTTEQAARTTHYFLLAYSRPSGVLMRFQHFTDPAAAVRERFAVEYEHRGDASVEVAVIGADSLAAARVNHARYFGGLIGGAAQQAIEEVEKELGES